MPIKLLDDFQAKYILGREADPKKGLPAVTPAFPCIPRWWQWVAQQIQTRHYLVTPFGRKRHFFGRDDDATLREAIAFLPQSTNADRMSLGMWRIWKYMPEVRLLGNGYDSVVFEYRESADEQYIVKRALELCAVPLECPTRTYTCPNEAKVGWNWGAVVTQGDMDKAVASGKRVPRLNPDGLAKWSPGRADARRRHVGLQRIAC
jgi:hypothetical protein